MSAITPASGSRSPTTYRVGADIGGTFTDIVLFGADGSLATTKVSSTPESFGRAIIEGIRELIEDATAAPESLAGVVHASTVATNAIIEMKGAKTGLVTTKGFRDVPEMRRLRIPVLYDLQYRKPPPLVPRRLRLEVDERRGPRGSLWRALDEDMVAEAARVLREAGVAAVAVSLLHSYADPSHEHRVAQILREHLPEGTYIACSADILPEIREYERTSTAVVSAYVGPIVRDYLTALQSDVEGLGIRAPLHVMQSNGGIMSVEGAQRKPASVVESGPAAGVIACARLARALGLDNAISFDMGGTTAKAAMVENGEPARTTEYEVGSGINLSSKLVKGGGYPIKLPFIDVSEIGAGGGSIIALDGTGSLSVGPASAGAVPGPICYGLGGTEPTFTDAVLALGYLNPVALAGGRVKLDKPLALAALENTIANPLGLSLEDVAHGIYEIAAATMTRAVKAVTTYRDRDPRDFVLVAFGGNGPVVGTEVARALSIRKVLVPPAPGVFSALGLLMSEIEHEFSITVLRRHDEMDEQILADLFRMLEDRARSEMRREARDEGLLTLRRLADLRYVGQAYELTIGVGHDQTLRGVTARFHQEHRATYGHGSEQDPVEMVSLRVYAKLDVGQTLAFGAPLRGGSTGFNLSGTTRKAYFGRAAGFAETPVLGRADLTQVWRSGPVIVEEYDATCVVPPDAKARLDRLGNIEIELLGEGA